MEFFKNAKTVRLMSAHGKYLTANKDMETVKQDSKQLSESTIWTVECVVNFDRIRLKSCYDKYLTASNQPFLLGMTGGKVLQTLPNQIDGSVEWIPIGHDRGVKLRSSYGHFLRGNGGVPPWKNSVTHNIPHRKTSQAWIVWNVQVVESAPVARNEEYLESSSFSTVETINTPQLPKQLPMELFRNAKVVRFKSAHGKYLTADEDEETVTQDRNGAARSAKWTVELVKDMDSAIRLKSCYGKYLTASNQPFLLGMTGLKVMQTLPERLDSSVEWEPERDHGGAVKLKTRYGQFLRANGGLPPWRNSVTHGIPHRTMTQEWVLWDVHVLEIVVALSPAARPPPPLVVGDAEEEEEEEEEEVVVEEEVMEEEVSIRSEISVISKSNSASFSKQESNDSGVDFPSHSNEGRMIYFRIADENGEIDEELEEMSISFNGFEVSKLLKCFERELGLHGLTICKRSPFNGKLYPLLLQLPPNNDDLHVVILPPHSKYHDFLY